jgi:cell division protein FtsW
MFGSIKKISGDKQLWVYTVLLMLFSFWIVYSASSNLSNVYGKSSPLFFGIKHFIHVAIGFVIIFVTHRFNPKYFSHMSRVAMPVMVFLLLYTLTRGVTVGGANASRWIYVPGLGSIQPSTIAFVFLMMFTARFLGKNNLNDISFSEAFKSFWIWVFAIVGLILPANLSTAVLVFSMVVLMTIIAGYPFKELFKVFGIGLMGLIMLILVLKAFPNKFSNRLDTWQSRIEAFFQPPPEVSLEKIDDKQYQITQAKIAIAKGGLFGFRPGKSVQKNFLPQSVSDFIFAIIVEEYSLTGALLILFVYLMLGLRMFFVAKKTGDKYFKLLVLSVGLPIIVQALSNMAVAVGLFPVTGQPLPLLSSGGTAIWMSSFAIGIILSVSRYTEMKQKGELEEFITE